jgi:TolA-binding protein
LGHARQSAHLGPPPPRLPLLRRLPPSAAPTTPPAPPTIDRSHASPPGGASANAPTDAETQEYAAAHRLHFVDHDSARALAAWDGYLAAYPTGRFALEARYNRALCLVRLSRFDDARSALGPFADGSYGGYRQREARDLLEAIDAR